MGIDSFWRVHLLNLWPSWTMFRLGRSSKLLTLVLDDPLVGEIRAAEILRGLKPSFAFFLDLSADSQIHLMGRAWINMEKDRSIRALRTLKCARIHKRSQIVVRECVLNVTGDLVRPSSLCDCTMLSFKWSVHAKYFINQFQWHLAMQRVLALFAFTGFQISASLTQCPNYSE